MKLVLGKLVGSIAIAATALTLTTIGTASVATVAQADSCWLHNGSLMRLRANGNWRAFYYENPRNVLRAAGVRRGTLLFEGEKRGNTYVGTARRFSKFCPGSPLVYNVRGPVASSQTRVTVSGSRQVHNRCQATGRTAWDDLVFTYSHRC